jgi:hypothetical protein
MEEPCRENHFCPCCQPHLLCSALPGAAGNCRMGRGNLGRCPVQQLPHRTAASVPIYRRGLDHSWIRMMANHGVKLPADQVAGDGRSVIPPDAQRRASNFSCVKSASWNMVQD